MISTNTSGDELAVLNDIDGVRLLSGMIPKKGVCLLYSNESIKIDEARFLVEALVPLGCVFILTFGSASDINHDVIDTVLEYKGMVSDGGELYLSVATTSHSTDSVSEVASFFINAAIPMESSLRYIYISLSRDGIEAALRTSIISEYSVK